MTIANLTLLKIHRNAMLTMCGNAIAFAVRSSFPSNKFLRTALTREQKLLTSGSNANSCNSIAQFLQCELAQFEQTIFCTQTLQSKQYVAIYMSVQLSAARHKRSYCCGLKLHLFCCLYTNLNINIYFSIISLLYHRLYP